MSVTFYVFLSAKYLAAFKQKHNGALNGKTTNFKWLQQFINVFSVFQVLWFIFLIPYVIPKYSNKLIDTVDWYPIYIPLAIIIYWLGIKGYIDLPVMQRAIISFISLNISASSKTKLPNEPAIFKNDSFITSTMFYLDKNFPQSPVRQSLVW